ncbi:MAG: hypothetical protein IPH54_06960 [Rhodoferax sp.]|nr:hypothetical protein [Rhodoferax sp.]
MLHDGPVPLALLGAGKLAKLGHRAHGDVQAADGRQARSEISNAPRPCTWRVIGSLMVQAGLAPSRPASCGAGPDQPPTPTPPARRRRVNAYGLHQLRDIRS